MQFIEPKVKFLDGDAENPLLIKKKQEIPQEFLDAVKDARHESSMRPMGNFHRVASIPVIIHEKWLREGFDCTQAPVQETIARLKRENLDAFLTTNKRI